MVFVGCVIDGAPKSIKHTPVNMHTFKVAKLLIKHFRICTNSNSTTNLNEKKTGFT